MNSWFPGFLRALLVVTMIGLFQMTEVLLQYKGYRISRRDVRNLTLNFDGMNSCQQNSHKQLSIVSLHKPLETER